MRLLTRGDLVAAVLDGAAYIEVAEVAGVSVSTAWRWVHADADDPPRRRPTLDISTRRKIRNMIDAGDASLRRIAVVVGVHHSTVCSIRDKMAVGGHRAKAVRCRECGAKIQTQVCLQCAASAQRFPQSQCRC